MDTVRRQQAILYVEGNRLFFYPGLSGATLQLAFPQDILSDLEVLNPQKLLDLLLAFFQTQKIPPSEILCILAPAIVFEKEFSPEEKKELVQQFLDFVPFDDILSKSFMNKKNHIFAINRQLYNILKQACEKSNCLLVGAVAYSSLTDMLPELSQKVDLPLILARFDSCKQFNLETASQQEIALPDKTPEKKENKRVYILLGIFGILVIILLITIFATSHTSPTIPTITTPRSLPVVVKSTPTPISQQITAPTSASTSAR